MDLLEMVLNASKGDALSKLASQHGISTQQAGAVISQLLPKLGNRAQVNIQQKGGLESLLDVP